MSNPSGKRRAQVAQPDLPSLIENERQIALTGLKSTLSGYQPKPTIYFNMAGCLPLGVPVSRASPLS